MKRILAGIAAGVLFAAAFAVGAARAETTLRVGEADHGDIDPHQGTLFADSILTFNIYDTLVFPSMDGKSTEMKPHLAEKIESDASGLNYTVTLRPNVKFHSGNVMTAEDVVFSMERMIAINKGYSYLFTATVKSTVAKDPRTVVFTLKEPNASFYASLVRFGIVDKKTVLANKRPGNHGDNGDYGVDWVLKNGAGTGAYQVISHSRTERTELRKFKDYFLGVSPKAPDVVRFSYSQPDLVVLTLFRQGEMDLVRPLIQPETKMELLKVKGVTLVPESGVQQFFLKMNNTKKPVDDVHCRKALALSIDYETRHALENVGDLKGAKPAKGPLLETHPGFDPNWAPYAKRDMAAAKAELAQCKYKPGDHRLQIVWMATNRKTERLALMMQQNWEELGFKADIESRIWAHFTEQVAKPDSAPMIVPVYVSTPIPDPDSYLYQTYHSSRHGQWLSAEYFKDAEVDAMLDKGRTMPGGAERIELYKKVATRIRDLQPAIFGFQQVNLVPKRDTFMWPNLEKPNMNTGIQGGNHLFRLMEMKTPG